MRRWPCRLLLLFLLLFMPYAAYYFTSPKPEPLQLSLIAAFLWLHRRRNYAFGWHWLLLGLAFGTKISVLPAALVFALASAVQESGSQGRAIKSVKAIDTVCWFIAGLGVAVPVLLIPVFVALALICAWRYFAPAALCGVDLAVAAVCLFIGARAGSSRIDIWLDQTFRNTAQGQDEARINAITWLDYFLRHWLGGPMLLNVAFFAVAALLVLWRAFRHAQTSGWRNFEAGFVLAVAGLAMIAAIFVSAHRLWGFYLFPGMVLMLVGLVATIELSLAAAPSPAAPTPDRTQRLAAWISVALCLSLGLFYWVPQDRKELNDAMRRTEDPAYRRDYATFGVVTTFLSSYSRSQGRQIVAMLDPILLTPSSTAEFRIDKFWGPYTAWDRHPDVLVFSKNHTAAGVATPSDSPEYKTYLAERAGYAKYVIGRGQPCRQAQCYERAVALADGGEILVRRAGPAR